MTPEEWSQVRVYSIRHLTCKASNAQNLLPALSRILFAMKWRRKANDEMDLSGFGLCHFNRGCRLYGGIGEIDVKESHGSH